MRSLTLRCRTYVTALYVDPEGGLIVLEGLSRFFLQLKCLIHIPKNVSSVVVIHFKSYIRIDFPDNGIYIFKLT